MHPSCDWNIVPSDLSILGQATSSSKVVLVQRKTTGKSRWLSLEVRASGMWASDQ